MSTSYFYALYRAEDRWELRTQDGVVLDTLTGDRLFDEAVAWARGRWMDLSGGRWPLYGALANGVIGKAAAKDMR